MPPRYDGGVIISVCLKDNFKPLRSKWVRLQAQVTPICHLYNRYDTIPAYKQTDRNDITISVRAAELAE